MSTDLHEIVDELRGWASGRGGWSAYEFEMGNRVASALSSLLDKIEDENALGEVVALTENYDGCHERVREWEASEQWEKDAHPEEEPFSDREDVAFWNRRATAVRTYLLGEES